VNIPCKLCGTRRARRHCPGVDGDICPQCCGSERENTIACPSTCEHLREARLHEAPAMASGTEFPNKDIRLTEKFIREHEPLIFTTAVALKRAMESGQAVDFDAREALEALIRTYRTLESGLIYETRPQNPYAAGIQESLQQSIAEFRKEMAEKLGMHSLRDADVLGTLVFVQRLEIQHNNGRRRGRAFLDFLTSYLPEPPAATVAV
jgi:hypothetical protein